MGSTAKVRAYATGDPLAVRGSDVHMAETIFQDLAVGEPCLRDRTAEAMILFTAGEILGQQQVMDLETQADVAVRVWVST